MWTHLPANLPHFSPFFSLQTKQPLPLCPSLDLSEDMEFAGNSAGGFHGYRRLPQTTADGAPDISMALPPQHNAAAASVDNANPNHNPNPNVNNNECVVREQDRFMPIANVIRIMRRILPPHAKISDDAKETIQECVSEYISFITSEANDRCQREQRKTITAEDVLWAMSKLGFDDYIEPLTLYLHRYREFDGGDRGALRGDHLMKPPPRPVVDHGYVGFPPGAFHHMGAPHPGFYGAAAPQLPPPMSLFKDSGNPGSSSACMEPYRQSKDQL